GVALEEDDVAVRDADFAQAADDLDDDGGAGDGADGVGNAAALAGLRGAAPGGDLDADAVALLEERAPAGPRGAGVRAGQLGHAAVDHGGDDRGVDGVVNADGGGMRHLDNAAGVAPGHGRVGARGRGGAGAAGGAFAETQGLRPPRQEAVAAGVGQ